MSVYSAEFKVESIKRVKEGKCLRKSLSTISPFGSTLGAKLKSRHSDVYFRQCKNPL